MSVESIKKEDQYDPYIKMETALPNVEEGPDSTGVYEVPVRSRQSSPIRDTTSLLPQEAEDSTVKGPPEASAGLSDKIDVLIEDDYVNPALFRKEAESRRDASAPVDASIYESMVAGMVGLDPDQGYTKVKRRAEEEAETSGEKAEELYARPFNTSTLPPFHHMVAVNSELHRTYTADNQYVPVRSQIGRRNASQPDLDIENPYSKLSDLHVAGKRTSGMTDAGNEDRGDK